MKKETKEIEKTVSLGHAGLSGRTLVLPVLGRTKFDEKGIIHVSLETAKLLKKACPLHFERNIVEEEDPLLANLNDKEKDFVKGIKSSGRAALLSFMDSSYGDGSPEWWGGLTDEQLSCLLISLLLTSSFRPKPVPKQKTVPAPVTNANAKGKGKVKPKSKGTEVGVSEKPNPVESVGVNNEEATVVSSTEEESGGSVPEA